MKPLQQHYKKCLLLTTACTWSVISFARVGGAGGHKSHTSHSGGSGGHGSYSGGGFSISGIIILIIIVVVVLYVKKKMGGGNMNNGANTFGGDNNFGNTNSFSGGSDVLMKGLKGGLAGGLAGALTSMIDESIGGMNKFSGNKNFPEGLNEQKIKTAFTELQNAWQQQDLSKVRKWMSDGVYQRFTAQFAMMKKLTQRNMLSNIRIHDISIADVRTDGAYQSADVAITFSMDDKFVSEKYPALNENYNGDNDTEYWTFIKRTDIAATPGADLYNTNNCPNCGASLENQLGEVSRCTSCQTLTNNAAYDWVLNEITQDEDYSHGNRLYNDGQLQTLVKNDNLFAIQRMEDIASNVFMQIMEVMSGDSNKKLERFAAPDIAQKIITQKAQQGIFVFDRLYLNEVTLSGYNTQNQKLNLVFDLTATYKRVQIGDKLKNIDNGFSEHRYQLTLSKNLTALQPAEKEIAFSYECANCGAPYDDTTKATCSYCDAPVVDEGKNWVLTEFL